MLMMQELFAVVSNINTPLEVNTPCSLYLRMKNLIKYDKYVYSYYQYYSQDTAIIPFLQSLLLFLQLLTVQQ